MMLDTCKTASKQYKIGVLAAVIAVICARALVAQAQLQIGTAEG
jgi:hypothetical protein